MFLPGAPHRADRGLSDAFTLFQSVDWARSAGQRVQHGEIDIAVVNLAGDVLVMVVKAGHTDFAHEGIFKTFRTKTKDVAAQVSRQYGAIRSRLVDAGLPVQLHYLLVLPYVKLLSESAQRPRECVVARSLSGNGRR